MSTVKVVNVAHPSSATNNIVLDSSGNASVGGTMAMGSSFMRNRIINGAMVIDQRNAGASVTPADSQYLVDRWIYFATQASKFTAQQSSTAPTGFTKSLLFTSSSSYSVGVNDYFLCNQKIEGYNIADLAWGGASAATITVSFWVRSSLTGMFGGYVANASLNRSYSFSFTINAANTWEQKTVTIAGDTTGTWPTDNSAALYLGFSLGSGSSKSTTAGSWGSTWYPSVTGATSVVGTNGATFYITGVQLEVGSVATPFEREIYSQTLAKCQRYYYRITPVVSARICMSFNSTTTVAYGTIPFPIKMRATPTALGQSGTASDYGMVYLATSQTCSAVPAFLTATPDCGMVTFTVASGLTAGQASAFYTTSTNSYLGWSVEL